MRKVVVTEFIVGLIVAEDIYSKDGKLLLRAGYPITATVIKHLQREKISLVWVK
ncbi:hypothetical protein [Paenibacillus thalictri]|uniref:hypothetical protein n=1 Tax=Paenibacillus thalictri TaxID=2527873 RepID=UPI0013EF55BF|nr:hypothetical protein [Paenibacillus thalictri]